MTTTDPRKIHRRKDRLRAALNYGFYQFADSEVLTEYCRVKWIFLYSGVPVLIDQCDSLARHYHSPRAVLLADALRACIGILGRDPTQLAGQLWARLERNEATQPLLESAGCAEPWLRASAPTLPTAGGVLTEKSFEGNLLASAVCFDRDGWPHVLATTDADGQSWTWIVDARGEAERAQERIRGAPYGSVARLFRGPEGGMIAFWDSRQSRLMVRDTSRLREVFSTDYKFGRRDSQFHVGSGFELLTWRGETFGIVCSVLGYRLIELAQGRVRLQGDADAGAYWALPCIIRDEPCLVLGNTRGCALLNLVSGSKKHLPVPDLAETMFVARAETSPVLVVAGSQLVVFDLCEERAVAQHERAKGGFVCVCAVPTADPGALRLVAGTDGRDRAVLLWDVLPQTAEPRVLGTHYGEVRSVTSYQHAGRSFAASAAFESTVKVFDLDSAVEVGELGGHRGGVESVTAASFDQSALLTTISDDCVRVWDPARATATKGRFRWILHGQDVGFARCYCDATFKQGPSGVSCSAGNFTIWNLAERRPVKSFYVPGRVWVNAIDFVPLGREGLVVGACEDGAARVFDLADASCTKVFQLGTKTKSGHVVTFQTSADSDWFAAVELGGEVQYLNVSQGRQLSGGTATASGGVAVVQLGETPYICCGRDGQVVVTRAFDTVIKQSLQVPYEVDALAALCTLRDGERVAYIATISGLPRRGSGSEIRTWCLRVDHSGELVEELLCIVAVEDRARAISLAEIGGDAVMFIGSNVGLEARVVASGDRIMRLDLMADAYFVACNTSANCLVAGAYNQPLHLFSMEGEWC